MRPLTVLATACLLQSAKAAPQKPFLFHPTSGIPWRDVLAIQYIDQWALNPSGDAAVIQTSAYDPLSGIRSSSLHLLAINAQFTIPSTLHGPSHPDALYTFIDDSAFLTVQPTHNGEWSILRSRLEYSSEKDAAPPTAEEPTHLASIAIQPKQVLYAWEAGVIVMVHADGLGISTLPLSRSTNERNTSGQPIALSQISGMKIDEVVTSGSELAFTAFNPLTRPQNSTRTILYTYDLVSQKLSQISMAACGAVSSPAFGINGRMAWLEQDQDGNARDQRKVWIFDGQKAWKVPLKFDLSPMKILFNKDGTALNLLTLHDQEQSLFHIWTPKPSDPPITPIRIPSSGTIHSAIHVGITPLNHSHLIGVKSSLTEAHELYVISHAPGSDPTDNYENIKLTNFSPPSHDLSSGERFSFVNDEGSTVHGRVFVPPGIKSRGSILYLHGDEEGGAWHDWWMPYWNPNAFIAEGYAVITINPTGAEGHGNNFTSARRHQWGGQAMRDLHTGLDFALDRFKLDRDSVYAMGYGAYGGWAMHWLQGHQDEWNISFRGFVSHGGILSPRWWAYETTETSKTEFEFGPISSSLDKDSPYVRWDPELSAMNWKTPELVITDGTNDADVGPPTHSLATYRLLQSLGIKSRLLESKSLYEWQKEIFAFLDSC